MFTGFQAVGVHRQAHRATGIAPFEIGGGKDFVQAFRFGLLFDQARAGHDQYLFHGSRFFPAFNDGSRGTQVFDTRVGARTDKDFVQLDVGNFLTGLQAHVLQGPFDALAFNRIRFLSRIGDVGIDCHHHFRRSAPADLRFNRCCIDVDDFVEQIAAIAVGAQILPIAHRHVPVVAFRCVGAALIVIDSSIVHRDQTGASARFNRHVADRHPAFHRQRPNGVAAEFDGVTVAAGGADLADDRQHDVLGGDARTGFAVDFDQHVFGFFLHQTLGCQRVFDF